MTSWTWVGEDWSLVGNKTGFEIGCTVNRKDWGITWNAPLEAGGVLVGDKATLDIDVSAVKRSG